MILRLTVWDAHARRGEDFELSASPDSPVGAVLDSLPFGFDTRPCFVGAAELDRGARLAGSPLLPGAVISVGAPGPDHHPVRGASTGSLVVADGPDRGVLAALRPGRHTIGRSRRAAITLRDTEVSREHAVVDVYPDGRAVAADAGSANGTYVDGIAIGGAAELGGGNVLGIGADDLRWEPAGRPELRVTCSADGRLEFDRVFTPTPAAPRGEVVLPPRDAPVARNHAALISGGVGIAFGLVGWAATKNPEMLWMSGLGVVSPLIIGAMDSQNRTKREQATTAARHSATAQITAAARAEEEALHAVAPGPAEIAAMTAGNRRDLWPRDARSPLGLTLRVGVADRPASLQLRGEPWDGFKPPVLRRVPVTVDLRQTGVLGVIGAGEPARSLLRWLVIQLAALRSPVDLRIVLLTSDSAGGDSASGDGAGTRWAAWLPHLDPGQAATAPCWVGNTPDSRAARIDELRTIIAGRAGGTGPGSGGGAMGFTGDVIVVLDGALELRNLPGIGEILRDGPDARVYALCADTHGLNECRGQCEVGDGEVRVIRAPHEPAVSAVPDGLDPLETERRARALAPMRDRAAAGDVQGAIPFPVRYLDLLGIGLPDAQDVLAMWGRKKPGPATRITLGADAAGEVSVDLAAQGPHTMLGGATGAGKSILLQTLVTALLLANRPDELNLVLVDFKGGSAFLPFENCPHVTALIRSTGETPADTFDAADAARLLASVRAEVRRREAALARYGGEIDTYWRARAADPGMASLPRLVMIFDEFARVLETSPDFLKELVSVAAKGRSLGMHLILATQSLQGKLSPELKNNISLRITLRQNEAADSVEVLGVPDAATIPGTLRGRGMILCTTDETRTPRPFQSGYLGDPPPSGAGTRATARALRWTDLGQPRPESGAPGAGSGATDQELIIAAVEKAAAGVMVSAPYRALLPPLPAGLPLQRLPEQWTAAPPEAAVAFGMTDVPDAQAQLACYLDLAATGRLLVAGGPQSGRTTFARAFITSLAARFRPEDVHLYVVEREPAGLADFAGLPHCGGVFSPEEPDRVRRLVTWLGSETRRRSAARVSAARVSAARVSGATAPGPSIVVLIDGWEQFENRTDPALADSSLGPRLRDVIANGAPLGVHVVPIGGEDMMKGKVPALCNQRLLLPFPNEDTRRAYLRAGMASPPRLPGRAIDAGSGIHVQICLPPSGGPAFPAVSDAGRLPRRFPSLPAQVPAGDLTPSSVAPSSTWIPLGIGGEDTATVGIDLFDADAHLLMISGPPGSGRTTAVAAVARALRAAGIGVLVLTPRRSPLHRLISEDDKARVVTGAVINDADLRSAAAPFGDDRYAILLDDADRLTMQPEKGFNPLPTLIDEIAQPGEHGRHALVMAGDLAPVLAGNRRGLTRAADEIKLAGTRVVLTPTNRSVTKQQHGLSLEPDQYFSGPPGRGYLASTGAPALIQLALPALPGRSRKETIMSAYTGGVPGDGLLTLPS